MFTSLSLACAEVTLGGTAADYLASIERSFANDLAIPEALATLWSLLRDGGVDDDQKLEVARRADEVFGLGLADAALPDSDVDEELILLIRERERAREEKNFARADEIRALLDAAGLIIEDTPSGTRWSKK